MTEEQWNAIKCSDASYDDLFFYAVRTTGIFCRPSCKSRAPKKENVRLFHDAEEALRAGFRPCKRCKPTGRRPPDREWVAQITDYIDQNYGAALTLESLAQQCHGSPCHLHRTFKKVTGLTPGDYVQRTRIAKAKELLLRSDVTIADIALAAGFPNTSYFATLFKKVTGQTPTAYRQSAAPAEQAVRWTELVHNGWPFLLAATPEGLCYAGSPSRSFEELAKFAQRHAPGAPLVEDEERLQPYVRQFAEYLQGERESFRLPLDLRGTAFQLAVWGALRAIPYGQTRSYSEIARQVGRPAAIRAVGTAIGANPLLIAIPCHRVIGKNGALSGYRGGLELKTMLLGLEARRADDERAPE